MLTILVVDDDLGTRLFIGDYLEANGYSILSAENGQEALALVQTYHPHLIITDISMPTMDGYELVKQVRQRPGLRLIPVIFLTARTEVASRILGYQAGADIYLPKPFEVHELGAVVRNLLERVQLIEAEWRFTQRRSQQSDLAPSHSSATTEVAASLGDRGGIAPNPERSPLAQTSSSRTSSERIAHDLQLTTREQEVLSIVADGHSNLQIGEQLHLSPRTVEKYVSSLLRKTNTNNRAELVRYALDHHLVDLRD